MKKRKGIGIVGLAAFCMLAALPLAVQASTSFRPATLSGIDNSHLTCKGRGVGSPDRSWSVHLTAQVGDVLQFRLLPWIKDPGEPSLLRISPFFDEETVNPVLASAQVSREDGTKYYDDVIWVGKPCRLVYVAESLRVFGRPGGTAEHPLANTQKDTLWKQLTGNNAFTLSGKRRAIYFKMRVTA